MARSFKKGMTIGAVTALVLSMSTVALAQGKAAAKESKSEDGYGYTFDDDPLNAGGFGPNDATIKVRPRAARTTLIRPRTSFVPEMLKSVENI